MKGARGMGVRVVITIAMGGGGFVTTERGEGHYGTQGGCGCGKTFALVNAPVYILPSTGTPVPLPPSPKWPLLLAPTLPPELQRVACFLMTSPKSDHPNGLLVPFCLNISSGICLVFVLGFTVQVLPPAVCHG